MKIKTFAIAFITFMFIFQSGAVFAAKCGGYKQRPCKVWERVPSCNKGLYESFKKKKCLRKKKRRKPRKRTCGALNQRPCKVWERIPSCNRGLYENFKRKKCLKRKRSRRVVKPCGGRNQRACCIAERKFGACKKGLIKRPRKNSGWCKGKVFQSQHVCIKANCGGLNKRPCKVWERVPSCNKGLVENFRINRCTRPSPKLMAMVGKLRRLGKVPARYRKEAHRKAKRFIRNLGPYVRFVKAVVRSLKRKGVSPKRLIKLHQQRKFKKIARLINARSLVRRARRLRNPLNLGSGYADRSFASVNTMANVLTKPSPFKTITVGAVGDISAIINFTLESGISIAPNGNAAGYWTVGFGAGMTIGADASIGIGFYVDPYRNIDGTTFGLTIAAADGAGGSITVYFAVKHGKLKVAGFAIAPQVGAGVEAEWNWWVTRTF